jgi:hypothetical protein
MAYDKRIEYEYPAYGSSKRPLREANAPSYDPHTGRAASSVDEPDSSVHITNGNHARPNRQLPRDDSGFQARDRRCTQSRVPVAKRPLG